MSASMRKGWPSLKIDPSMKIALRDIPEEVHDLYCHKLREWSRNISPNQLAKIMEKSHTSIMYFNQAKRGHQVPSRSWNNRIIEAGIAVSPDYPLIIDEVWL